MGYIKGKGFIFSLLICLDRLFKDGAYSGLPLTRFGNFNIEVIERFCVAYFPLNKVFPLQTG
jgi:hypothetical protein